MKSGLKSGVFEKFSAIAESIMNPSVEVWKKDGGRVMGYTCSFVPEELIIAAGMLPFRIRATGSTGGGLGDDYFNPASICSMIRCTFGKVLAGEYDFIDGAIIGGGCDGNRHILDNWKKSPKKMDFLETIFFPHASGEAMSEYFKSELAGIRSKIEKHFGVSITDDNLRGAIKICNEIRDLQKELYALRKSANPPITGSETVSVIVAGTSMPKGEYRDNLKKLIAELKEAKVPDKKYAARLMIVGPGHDETSMCEVVEGLGGLVAADLTCFGGKMIFGRVSETEPDPLKAIADYQVIERPFCPKNLNAQQHINKEVFDKIRDLKIDGVIGQNFLCCDMWGGALYILNRELKEAGIPMLRIEREYSADSTGQLKTRVQAFIETISGGAL
jgi:benzoyl-CoA reductase/2-hydroxyglutaryl-CoA dehydratase subunit BcrC/BadD/HgdB